MIPENTSLSFLPCITFPIRCNYKNKRYRCPCNPLLERSLKQLGRKGKTAISCSVRGQQVCGHLDLPGNSARSQVGRAAGEVAFCVGGKTWREGSLSSAKEESAWRRRRACLARYEEGTRQQEWGLCWSPHHRAGKASHDSSRARTSHCSLAGGNLPLPPHQSESSSPFKAQLTSHLLQEVFFPPKLAPKTVSCSLTVSGLTLGCPCGQRPCLTSLIPLEPSAQSQLLDAE